MIERSANQKIRRNACISVFVQKKKKTEKLVRNSLLISCPRSLYVNTGIWIGHAATHRFHGRLPDAEQRTPSRVIIILLIVGESEITLYNTRAPRRCLYVYFRVTIPTRGGVVVVVVRIRKSPSKCRAQVYVRKPQRRRRYTRYALY